MTYLAVATALGCLLLQGHVHEVSITATWLMHGDCW